MTCKVMFLSLILPNILSLSFSYLASIIAIDEYRFVMSHAIQRISLRLELQNKQVKIV